MCLVISILLSALGINFYLNGFHMQALLMAVLAIGFMFLMIGNVRCRQKSCGLKKDKCTQDEKSGLDSEGHTPLNQQEAENK